MSIPPASVTAENTRIADLGLWLAPDARGALFITDLADTGPIAGLGLQPGDILVSLNGRPVTNEQEFLRGLLAGNVRDQQLNLVINRSGASQVVQLTPSSLVRGIVQPDPFFQSGLILDASNPTRLVVERVFPRTPAFYAGLRTGDVITTAGGQRIASLNALQRALATGMDLPVQVTRDGRQRTLTLSGGGMFRSQPGLFNTQRVP